MCKEKGVWIVMLEGYADYQIVGVTSDTERAHEIYKEYLQKMGLHEYWRWKKVVMHWREIE